MEITKIAIYGASGHGKVVAEIAEALGYEVAFFIDDEASKKEILGYEVVQYSSKIALPIALGIGSNRARAEVYKRLKSESKEVIKLVHPSATISKRCSIGEGSVVMAKAIINSSSKVGVGAIINTASIVEHDNRIGDFVHISPNVALAGDVEVGDMSHVGIGSCVIQGLIIGKGCIVGAGSVVVENIPDDSKVVGNPAKRYLKKGE